ncbi:MAG: ATP-binding cassette domain-containing protein [Gammaproteobacteria bacterium]|nr:ATP-binding cassette domain-containing protein [Gammaproteobacteria bacterium]
MIRAEGLCKNFGNVEAVIDASFSADDGKVTALLGPNGAGKSTSLRMLSTVIKPSSGYASVDGHDVSSEPMAVCSCIGVLPHATGLYGRLSARENIRYYGELHGMSRDKLDARIDSLIELLDMSEFSERRVEGFSQGQRIKVALARAIVHNPRNVLLDEPTNGLDVMATRALREIILGFKAEGRCVLFSSHVMQEVANLCDDVIIIGQGRVQFQGTLDRLKTDTGQEDLEEAFIKVIEAEA